MRKRLLVLEKEYSLFLFGARSVGKSTLVGVSYDPEKCLMINLLDAEQEDRLARHPNELIELVGGAPSQVTHVIIDEIQKIPKLLDIVHLLLESL